MKNRGAVARRQTGHFQFLESGRRHGGNLSPMLNRFRSDAASFTDFPVSGVVFELQRKEFEGERIEVSEGRVPRAPILVLNFRVGASENSTLQKNGFAQTRGET